MALTETKICNLQYTPKRGEGQPHFNVGVPPGGNCGKRWGFPCLFLFLLLFSLFRRQSVLYEHFFPSLSGHQRNVLNLTTA